MQEEPLSLDVTERIAREEGIRAARLTRVIIPVLFLMLSAEAILALLTPDSDLLVTALVFAPGLLIVATAFLLQRTGYPRAAGWIVSLLIWAMTASSMWFFGGLHHEFGAGLVTCIILAAATLGSRAAFVLCGLSLAATTTIALVDARGGLPVPPLPLHGVVGWIAITIALVLGTTLVHLIIKGLREAMLKTLIASSERDAARIRYLQAQKMEPVGRLASGVAHDFNNLLTVMTGVSSLLREEERDPAFVESLLDDLDSATARATLMTGQLLAFTRNRPEAPQSLDIAAVARDMIPLLARLIGDDIKVELTVIDEHMRVRADRGQFEQVILNLAVNARDAMPEGGTLGLDLRFAPEGDRAVITVTDSGVGMDASLFDKVFTPFFTTKRTGTGLGLATVKDIVTQYQGELELTSTVGQGTCFRIAFPLAADHESRRTTIPGSAVEARPGRLLLVEDHDLVRRTNRRALEQAGFEVTAVIDGAEALSLIESGGRFDIIVTDMMMPRMGGADLGLELEARRSVTPVLFVSGNFDQAPAQLQALGYPSKFLAKPFAFGALLNAVGALMAEARLREVIPKDAVG